MITQTVNYVENANFNVYRNCYNKRVTKTSEKISPGLVKRLIRYTEREIESIGFSSLIDAASAWEIETNDGKLKPSERLYHVTLSRPEGGQLILNGIMTDHGHPFLNHGFGVDF